MPKLRLARSFARGNHRHTIRALGWQLYCHTEATVQLSPQPASKNSADQVLEAAGETKAVSLSSSQFGRCGSRDDRRRRLLTEDRSTADGPGVALTASSTSRVGPQPVHQSEHYGDAEFLGQQPGLFDLAPWRLISFALFFVAGLALIAGLEALYAWSPALAAKTAAGRITALELGAKGSLGVWFSSLVLLAASLVAVVIYTVRRHRMDDYHGRYRIWLWAAMCWFLLATDMSASLHDGFRDLMILLSGARLMGDGSIWWLIGYGLLLGAIGSRLLIDMWTCRLSSAAMVLAGGCYIVALLPRFGLLSLGEGIQGVMFQQGAAMGGHWLLLLAMGLHARHVLLDAEGHLPRRPAKVKKKKPVRKKEPEKDDSATDKEWITVDSPHASPQPVLKRVSVAAPAMTSTPAAAASSPPPTPSTDHKLSKSERKALKQRLLQERLKREQQKQGNWGK